MARSRNIKPGLFANEVLGEADPITVLTFAGLWTLADKKGRLEDRPKKIRAQLFPYKSDVDMELILAWLKHELFISRYQVNNKSYIQVLNWSEHQSPHHKETESKIPEQSEESLISSAQEVIHLKQQDRHAQSKQEPSTNQASPQNDAPTPLIPDSLNSDSLNPIPDSLNLDHGGAMGSATAKPAKPISTLDKKSKQPAKSHNAWLAYSAAYQQRYKVAPLRNAKTNRALCTLVDSVGVGIAPQLARFYLTQNDFYAARMHDPTLLASDCSKLHTLWQTGGKIKTQSEMDNEDLIAELNGEMPSGNAIDGEVVR